MSQYLTYIKYHSLNDASGFLEFLSAHQISYLIEHEVNQLDKIYIGESLDPMFAVKVPAEKFNELNTLIKNQGYLESDKQGEEVYYLEEFTTEELLDVVNNPDDWNLFDIKLAKELLKKQNIIIEEPDIIPDQQAFLGEKLERQWVIFGYIFSFISVVGIFFGLTIVTLTKTLSYGEVVKVYDQNTRKHGIVMMIIGIISTLIFVTGKFF